MTLPSSEIRSEFFRAAARHDIDTVINITKKYPTLTNEICKRSDRIEFEGMNVLTSMLATCDFTAARRLIVECNADCTLVWEERTCLHLIADMSLSQISGQRRGHLLDKGTRGADGLFAFEREALEAVTRLLVIRQIDNVKSKQPSASALDTFIAVSRVLNIQDPPHRHPNRRILIKCGFGALHRALLLSNYIVARAILDEIEKYYCSLPNELIKQIEARTGRRAIDILLMPQSPPVKEQQQSAATASATPSRNTLLHVLAIGTCDHCELHLFPLIDKIVGLYSIAQQQSDAMRDDDTAANVESGCERSSSCRIACDAVNACGDAYGGDTAMQVALADGVAAPSSENSFRGKGGGGKGHVAMVIHLLSRHKADPRVADKSGKTLLHVVAETPPHIFAGFESSKKGSSKPKRMADVVSPAVTLLRQLVQSASDFERAALNEKQNNDDECAIKKQSSSFVNQKDVLGRSALFYAVKEGNAPQAKVLINELNADVTLRDVNGATVLHLAASTQGVLLDLVRLIADVGTKQFSKSNGESGGVGKEEASTESVSSFVNIKDKEHNVTALFRAFENCNIEVGIMFATEFQADASCIHSVTGFTPLHHAIVRDADGSDYYASYTARRGVTIVSAEIIRHFITKLNAPVNLQPTQKCKSLLWIAISVRRFDLANVLLNEFHADASTGQSHTTKVDQQTHQNLPDPLLHAAVYFALDFEKNNKRVLECIKLLVEKGGADIEERDHYGRTALHLAAELSPANFVMKLITEFGADPQTCDEDGSTLLHVIMANRRITSDFRPLIRYLVEVCGVPINARSRKSGKTAAQALFSLFPLSAAHWKVLRYLVLMGADLNYEDTAQHDDECRKVNNGEKKESMVVKRPSILLELLFCERTLYETHTTPTSFDLNGRPLRLALHLKVLRFLIEVAGVSVNNKPPPVGMEENDDVKEAAALDYDDFQLEWRREVKRMPTPLDAAIQNINKGANKRANIREVFAYRGKRKRTEIAKEIDVNALIVRAIAEEAALRQTSLNQRSSTANPNRRHSEDALGLIPRILIFLAGESLSRNAHSASDKDTSFARIADILSRLPPHELLMSPSTAASDEDDEGDDEEDEEDFNFTDDEEDDSSYEDDDADDDVDDFNDEERAELYGSASDDDAYF